MAQLIWAFGCVHDALILSLVVTRSPIANLYSVVGNCMFQGLYANHFLLYTGGTTAAATADVVCLVFPGKCRILDSNNMLAKVAMSVLLLPLLPENCPANSLKTMTRIRLPGTLLAPGCFQCAPLQLPQQGAHLACSSRTKLD